MSEFWKRKVKTFFTLCDYDKDGVMSKDDWMGLARRFSTFEAADKQKIENLLIAFDKTWDQRVKYAGSKERVTVDEFVDSVGKQRYDPDMIKCDHGLIYGFFNLMDVNSDGYLQEDEFKRIYVQFGVPDASWTKATFQEIDVNGDGKLSFDEYFAGFNDYFYSENENSPYKNFFGPLVD